MNSTTPATLAVEHTHHGPRLGISARQPACRHAVGGAEE
jgi:hypothetical protein